MARINLVRYDKGTIKLFRLRHLPLSGFKTVHDNEKGLYCVTIDELYRESAKLVGQELGPTAWRDVLQTDINAFGACTYDPDLMHIDPEWAARNSPFGKTIAFGFWTFSMLTCFIHELQGNADGMPHDAYMGINYGFDRLRFIEPVPVGSRIRARMTLAEVQKTAPDRILRAQDVTVEIEDCPKPALAARWLTMMVLPDKEGALTGFRRNDATGQAATI